MKRLRDVLAFFDLSVPVEAVLYSDFMRPKVTLRCAMFVVIVYVSSFNSFAAKSGQSFEVASIKPNTQGYIDLGGGARLLSGATRCRAVDSPALPGDPIAPAATGRCNVGNSTLKELINVAYSLRAGAPRTILNQFIIGGPSWAETAAFDIEAKTEDASAPTSQQMLSMLQSLLADRFRLRLHREQRDVSGFALVVSKDGSKLVEANPAEPQNFTAAPRVRGQKMPIATIANLVAQRTGRIVVDKTGLTGLYDFSLTWTPDETEFSVNGLPASRTLDQTGPSLVTALQDQLGLRLEPQKVPMQVLVIDSVEMPSAN
jgi:uncharacterized protein (TIGR03435 family)